MIRWQLADVLIKSFNSLMSGIHTCLPGRIEKYDATKKKASIQPLIKIKFKKQTEHTSMPIINNVPVQFPCTRKSLIHFPLERGDGCLLLFSERSLEKYLNTVITKESEPQDPRRFALSDAIAIPGLFSFSDTGKVASNSNALEISSDYNIELNGNTKSFVTFAELDIALQPFVAAINAALATKKDEAGSAGTLTLDISAAETTTIKTGG